MSEHRNALASVRAELNNALIERSDQIDGTLAALLCKRHVLLLGPPGTAKSALSDLLCKAIDGAKYFTWLMSKFTTPEEIFGPMSLKSIENDDYYRITRGKLPECHMAFLDEIFKSNSAILNQQLTIINEGRFDNGSKTIAKVPLISMIGASNELPESEELEALYDRFMVKYWVRYIVDRSNMKQLITSDKPTINAKITMDQLELCSQEAMAVKIGDPIIEAILNIKTRMDATGLSVSDRTWQRIPNMLKCYAYVLGCNEVEEDHLDFMCDMLWRDPKNRNTIVEIVGKVGNPLSAEARKIQDAAHDLVANLGEPPRNGNATPTAVATWRRKAADTVTTLTNMVNDIDTLGRDNKDKNLSKLKTARQEILSLNNTVMRYVSDCFKTE